MWHAAGTAARRAIVARGQQPTHGRLAAEMEVPKPTLDRHKPDWGSPDAEHWHAEHLRQRRQSRPNDTESLTKDE
jgi:hypothetical protein